MGHDHVRQAFVVLKGAARNVRHVDDATAVQRVDRGPHCVRNVNSFGYYHHDRDHDCSAVRGCAALMPARHVPQPSLGLKVP